MGSWDGKLNNRMKEKWVYIDLVMMLFSGDPDMESHIEIFWFYKDIETFFLQSKSAPLALVDHKLLCDEFNLLALFSDLRLLRD